MDLGLDEILPFGRDPGDRNRTSPFAFTGNRFEFRAVGSSNSVAGPLIAMNTMLADSLDWIAERLEVELTGGASKAQAVAAVLKELMELHSNIIFDGDGYSDEWHREAETRGLRNLPTTADALPVLLEEDVVSLFERTEVLSPVELESRYRSINAKAPLELGGVREHILKDVWVVKRSMVIGIWRVPAFTRTVGQAAGSSVAWRRLPIQTVCTVEVLGIVESPPLALTGSNAGQSA